MQIGQIAVSAQDIDRCTTFYRDVVGLEHLFSVPPKMTFFDAGGVRLMFSLPEGNEHDHPSSILYFKVDDIDATYARMVAGSAEFIETPHIVAPMKDHDLWIAAFRDGEGNTMALMEERKRV